MLIDGRFKSFPFRFGLYGQAMISLEPVAQQTRWCPDNYDGQEQSEKELVPRFKEILENKL
jgi:hypothetical protein